MAAFLIKFEGKFQESVVRIAYTADKRPRHRNRITASCKFV